MPLCKTYTPVRHVCLLDMTSCKTYHQIRPVLLNMHSSKAHHSERYASLKTCPPIIHVLLQSMTSLKTCSCNTCYPERHVLQKNMSSHETYTHLRQFCIYIYIYINLFIIIIIFFSELACVCKFVHIFILYFNPYGIFNIINIIYLLVA